eukprot:m.156574 g.156574  ORF g.156574 m.156574 type:complete len:70 (-) comp31005_c0_seq1:2495-2704(-)
MEELLLCDLTDVLPGVPMRNQMRPLWSSWIEFSTQFVVNEVLITSIHICAVNTVFLVFFLSLFYLLSIL